MVARRPVRRVHPHVEHTRAAVLRFCREFVPCISTHVRRWATKPAPPLTKGLHLARARAISHQSRMYIHISNAPTALDPRPWRTHLHAALQIGTSRGVGIAIESLRASEIARGWLGSASLCTILLYSLHHTLTSGNVGGNARVPLSYTVSDGH